MATLLYQDRINRAGYDETPPVRVLRTQMDVGIDKTRRRSSNAARPVNFKIYPLTDAEVDLFDAFYLTNDAVKFTYTSPRTDTNVYARFLTPPKYNYVETGWEVTINAEILP